MEEQAQQMGANAVITADLNYEDISSGGGTNMLMVSAGGAAVIID